jgi:NitT/TauT family transport system substrate-binding protein
MPPRRLFHAMLVCALLVLGLGCSSPEADDDLDTLRISAGPYLAISSLYLGVERGYFEDVGLKIEIVPLTNSSQALPLLAGGKLDATFGGFTPSLGNAVLKDARVRIVAGREILSPACAISGTLYASGKSFPQGLTDMADLRGKRVAISRRGGISEVFLGAVLGAGGLTEADVEVIPLRTSDATGAIMGGRVDAMFASVLEYSRPVASGKVFAALPLSKVLPNFQYSYIIFGERLLDEQTLELGSRFLSAYRRACHAFQGGETPQFMIDYATKNDLDVDATVKACRTTFRADGAVQLDDLERQIAFYQGKKYIESPLDAEQVVDLRFLERLDSESEADQNSGSAP